jgi:hypothetical protein
VEKTIERSVFLVSADAEGTTRRLAGPRVVRAAQYTLMLLLDSTVGLMLVVMPETSAALLPFAFSIYVAVLIIWVALTVLLLFGAYTGMKLKYDDDG